MTGKLSINLFLQIINTFCKPNKKILLILLVLINLIICRNTGFGQWVQCSGISGGNIRALMVKDNNIFAGTTSGVWKSTNQGQTWINIGLNNVGSLAFVGSQIYAGTVKNNISYDGVYITTNDGISWSKSLGNRVVFSLAASGISVFAGTFNNSQQGIIYRTTNNGQTWENSYQSNQYGDSILTIFKSSNNIYSSMYSGSIFSSNEGQTWYSLNIGKINCFASLSNYLFAGRSENEVGMWRTTNNGQNWTDIMNNHSIWSLMVSEYIIFAGTENGTLLSLDNGQTWVQKNEGFASNPTIYSYCYDNNFIYAGTNQSVWRRLKISFITPELQYPLNNSNGNSINPTLQWNQATYATKYHLIVAKDASFNQIVFNDSNITSTEKNINNLELLTNYYWKVRAGNEDGYGSYSATWNFKTKGYPAHIAIIYPGKNSINIPVNPTFKWFKAVDQTLKNNFTNLFTNKVEPNNILNYRFELATDSLFNNVILADTALTDTVKSVTGLNNLTNYYWRVKANSEIGWGEYEISKFQTIIDTPNVITQLMPLKNSVNISVTPYFNWNKDERASNYTIEISSDSNFTVLAFRDSTITDTVKQASGLNNLTKYYWRVNARNVGGTGPWSEKWSFTTTVATPVLISPLNNSVGNLPSITLTWNQVIGAVKYHLIVATDPDFTQLIFNDSNLLENQQTINGLNSLTYYYWKVKAGNISGYGNYSNTWNFKTKGLPYQLSAYYPQVNSINIPVNITFRWYKALEHTMMNNLSEDNTGNFFFEKKTGNKIPVNNEYEPLVISKYWFELVKDTVAMNGLISDSTLTDTTKAINGLSKFTNYYWRVKAKNEIGWGPFSAWWKFTTVPNIRPTPKILSSIFNPNAGRILTQNYTFTSTGSTDPDGTIDSVQWFVNYTKVSSDTSFSYDYPQGITFLKLLVIDNDGGRDSSTTTITRTAFRKYLGGPVYAGLSLTGDSVMYAIATGDKVYRMDINGNILYDLSVNGSVLSSSSISSDTSVYIGSSDNNLYAFSRYGLQIWPVFALGGQATATPTLDSITNRIYIGTSNGFLQVVNRTTGTGVWNSFVGSAVKSSAVITMDRKLVLATAKGDVVGFNLNSTNTSPEWSLVSSDSILNAPSLDNNGYVYVGTKGGKLKKITLPSGQSASILWQSDLGSPVNTSPVIDAAGYIYVGLQNGNLIKVNSSNGEVIWTFSSSSAIKTTPALSRLNKIYFGNANGEIIAIDSSKNVLWYYKDSSSIGNALLFSKGTIYAGTTAGRVLAIYDGSNFLENPNMNPAPPMWGTYQGNNRRTGSQYDVNIGIKKFEEEIPQNYFISNNYPNPFNPSTRIKYGIPKESKVKLVIYDMLGREIKTLVNETQKPGVYEATFSADYLSSGIYFYRIITKDFVRTQRMVLIK